MGTLEGDQTTLQDLYMLQIRALQMHALHMQAWQMHAWHMQTLPAWTSYVQTDRHSPLLDNELVEYPISHCSTTASSGEDSCSGSEDAEPGAGLDCLKHKGARKIKVDRIETETDGTRVVVDWPVDASKFAGNDRQIVSPGFEIASGVACMLMIQPSFVGERKGQRGFNRAKGKGSIHLKCEANTSVDVPRLSFSLAIGANGSWQPTRGPVAFSFSHGSVCSLPQDEEWDFSSVVARTSKICKVRLEATYK